MAENDIQVLDALGRAMSSERRTMTPVVLTDKTVSRVYHEAVEDGDHHHTESAMISECRKYMLKTDYGMKLPRLTINVRGTAIPVGPHRFHSICDELRESHSPSKSFRDNVVVVDISERCNSPFECVDCARSVGDMPECSVDETDTSSWISFASYGSDSPVLPSQKYTVRHSNRPVFKALFPDDGNSRDDEQGEATSALDSQPLEDSCGRTGLMRRSAYAVTKVSSNDSGYQDTDVSRSISLTSQTNRAVRNYELVQVLSDLEAIVSIKQELVLLVIQRITTTSRTTYSSSTPEKSSLREGCTSTSTHGCASSSLVPSPSSPSLVPSPSSSLVPSPKSPSSVSLPSSLSPVSSPSTPICSTPLSHDPLCYLTCDVSPVLRERRPTTAHSSKRPSAAMSQGSCSGCVILDSYSDNLYTIGGYNRSGTHDAVHTFNTSEGEWQENLCTLPYRWAHGNGAVLKDNSIYIAGGTSHKDRFSTAIRTVSKSPLLSSNLNGKWTTVASLLHGRREFAMSSFSNGEAMIAAGGRGEPGYTLRSAELFSLSSNEWRSIASLHHPRRCCFSTALGSDAYVMGGEDRYFERPIESVERYDVIRDEWIVDQPLLSSRRSASSCSMMNRIYVSGGAASSSALSITEAFDPREGKWQSLTPMNRPRHNHGMVSLYQRNSIAVVGGYDGKAFLNTTEWLDIRFPLRWSSSQPSR